MQTSPLVSPFDVWQPRRVARVLALAAFAAVILAGAIARAAPPTVLILPFAQPADAHRDLGFAVELKVTGALRAMGKVNIVHPKIRDSVVRRHTQAADMSDEQRRQAYARYVGATWTLEGTVADAPQPTIQLSLKPASGGEAVAQQVSAPKLSAAIAALPAAILKLMNAADGEDRGLPAELTPKTDRPDALARLATCYRLLNDQSVGIRKPALLNDERVYQAGNRCREALRRAPDLAEAEAGLAMVDALEGRVDDAKARLAQLKDYPEFLAYYWIAKFWVLAKFFNPQQAVDALATAIERNPGFMLGQSYLGEALSVMGRHEDSLRVYQQYLANVPDQPFVMARIGHELARLGRHKEAIAVTRKAVERDPENSEIRLQLGSRLIDSREFEAAVGVLSGLARSIEARGEVYVRLGYAQLRLDRLPEAEESFRRALELATAPQEWSTRGRAHYDLAKLHARQKKLDTAFGDLANAIDAGFKDFDVLQEDPDLAPLRSDKRFAALMKRNPNPPEIPVRYQSPFLLDPEEIANALRAGASPVDF